MQQTHRTSLGSRAAIEYIEPYGSTVELPIFEKLFLGGEYSIRGFDIRSVGPRDPVSRLVIGGNKSLLFNAEYLISIAGPVRLVLFADAGQVRDEGEPFSWTEKLDPANHAGRHHAVPGRRPPGAAVPSQPAAERHGALRRSRGIQGIDRR